MDSTIAADRLDAVFADYLLRRDADPRLLPATFADQLPEALRGPFLAEVEGLGDIDRLTAEPPADLPASIGRYRVLSLLGRGATGIVYEAEQGSLGRRVAIKVLHEDASRGLAPSPRFRREAQIVASLHHPSIVAVHDFDEEGGRPVLVMQLAPGRSLRALLTARRDPDAALHPFAERVLGDPRRLARTFAKIAAALAFAHDRGVVHRDLKPANIMVDEYGHPTVLDFGLARSQDGDLASLTRDGDVIGTPLYMAPEQLAGEPVGPAADLWALGSLLQECLTGEPAAGPHGDGRAALPALLGRLVAQCRERDPARRPASAAHVAAELDAFADRRSWWPGRPRRARGALGHSRRWVAVAAAAALGAGAALAVSVARSRDGGPSTETRLERLERALLDAPTVVGIVRTR